MNAEKARHEAFVRTAEGSSFSEIALILVLLPIVVSYERLLVHLFHRLFPWKITTTTSTKWNSIDALPFFISFIVGFGVVVLPLLFLITNPEITTWGFVVALVMLLTLFISRKLPRALLDYPTIDSNVMKTLSKPEKPFITAYRSSLLVITCIAILAVDFSIFPRRFAKTETFGTSLMDVGVGAFMFSGALVSRDGDDHSSRGTVSDRIVKTLKSVTPLLALGFARLFFIKSVDYQENVSEYGVHWNFFFTLGFLRLLHAAFVIPSKYSGTAAIVITLLYEVVLIYGGGTEFIVSDLPRTNFISMNKEGLFSVVGYFSIFLFGLQIGKYLLGEKQHRRSKKDWLLVLVKMIAIDILFWTATYLVHNHVQPTSRRMANMGYVLSTVSYNLMCVAGFLAVDIFVKPIDTLPTEILDAFNYNSLPLFLLANVLTGLTNLSMKTIDASNVVGNAVLVIYMAVLSLVAVLLKRSRWKLRL